MTKKKQFVGLCLLLALGLSGCAEDAVKSDDLSVQQSVPGIEKLGTITVVSREEGSGTRGTFAEVAGFDNDGKSDKADLTREDAVIAENADEVLAQVEKDTAAIGYVSKGAVAQDTNVKILSVNSIGIETKNGGYPLSRSFYLAYNGKLSDLQQDFMTYIKSKGQAIVSEKYVAVSKSSSFLSNKAEGTLQIQGSTSVAPLMEELAIGYEKENSNANVEVVATDSTDGLNQVMQEKCDFGMSSRELKDYEKELLDYETIAQDDVAVVVNKENPIRNITLESLKKIYTGEWKEWKELNP